MNEAAAPFGSDREVPEDHGLAEPAAASDKAEKVKRRAWMSVVVLIMRQSYVLSLIAMMVSRCALRDHCLELSIMMLFLLLSFSRDFENLKSLTADVLMNL